MIRPKHALAQPLPAIKEHEGFQRFAILAEQRACFAVGEELLRDRAIETVGGGLGVCVAAGPFPVVAREGFGVRWG